MSVTREAKRVLLVDDDPVILRGYATRLQTEGFDVATADDGFEAVNVAAQGKWNVVLLDLRLPSRSGLDVLRAFRARRDLSLVPILVLMQPGDEDLAKQAMRDGADGVLDKSRTAPKDVVAAVQQALDAPRRIGPPPQSASKPAAPVPAGVAEIANRFRRNVPKPPADPNPSAPNATPRPGRESYDEESAAPAAVATAAPSAPAKGTGRTYEVVVNQIVGQASQLARALSMPTDYACPECHEALVLRLACDRSRKFGVTGQFLCRACLARDRLAME